MHDVPLALAEKMSAVFGAAGSAWLARFAEVLAECERRWSIRVWAPLPGLSFNYVAEAESKDGEELILKLGVPNPELTTEIEALRMYDGQGAVRLLEADADLGAVLLERLRPGTDLCALDDEQAMSIAAGVMRRLWRPLGTEHPFPTVARWAGGLERLRRRFDGGSGPLPAALVDRAEALYRELLASAGPPVLLHGDLHHYNILAAQREPWLAIDPKGLAGEPAYEAGPLLYNPLPHLLDWPQPGRVMARRLDQLAAELGLDRGRIAGWAIAASVLSAWWSVEDGQENWDYFIECARLLSAAAG